MLDLRIIAADQAIALRFDCRRSVTKSYSAQLVLALGLLIVSGCGPATDRLKITGEVLLDGAPLTEGSIRFSGSAGEKSYSTGAMVRDGEFSIPRDKGLPPGTYSLQITSPDTAAPVKMIAGTPVAPDRIPPRYNVESKETIEVTADGANHFEFDIKSRPGA